jgi:hypothetical protein
VSPIEGQWRGADALLRHLDALHALSSTTGQTSVEVNGFTHARTHARVTHIHHMYYSHAVLLATARNGQLGTHHTPHSMAPFGFWQSTGKTPQLAHTTQHTQFSFLLAVIGWLVAMHQQHQMVQTLTLKRPTALVSHGEPMSFVRHCGVVCQLAS